jgi:hypothetical protein
MLWKLENGFRMSLSIGLSKCGSPGMEPTDVSACTHIKTRGHLKPNNAVGKTGYKRENAVGEGLQYTWYVKLWGTERMEPDASLRSSSTLTPTSP